MNKKKLAEKLGPIMPAILQSLGLPPVPIDPGAISELFDDDDDKKVDGWEVFSKLKLLEQLDNSQFRILVETVLHDNRFRKVSHEFLGAMCQVGYEFSRQQKE